MLRQRLLKSESQFSEVKKSKRTEVHPEVCICHISCIYFLKIYPERSRVTTSQTPSYSLTSFLLIAISICSDQANFSFEPVVPSDSVIIFFSVDRNLFLVTLRR